MAHAALVEYGQTTDEAEFVYLINLDRSAAGLTPLNFHPELLVAARRWATSMRDTSAGFTDCLISHNPNLRTAVNAPWRRLGENVGCGNVTVASLHGAFMNSPSHRANIMSANFDSIGIGIAMSADAQTIFVTEQFMELDTTTAPATTTTQFVTTTVPAVSTTNSTTVPTTTATAATTPSTTTTRGTNPSATTPSTVSTSIPINNPSSSQPTSPSTGAVNGFVEIVPARLLDTRVGAATIDAIGSGAGLRAASQVTELQVTSRANVSPSAQAVALNVTSVSPEADGYLTVYSCDAPRPTASHLNFLRAQTIPNMVISEISRNGTVCIYSSALTNVIVDATGYFPSQTGFYPMTPSRLLDTRIGGSTVDGIGAASGEATSQTTTRVAVRGRAGIPPSAAAVVLNVTAIGKTGEFITAFPCDTPRPTASNVNLTSNGPIANAVISKVGANGDVCIFTSASAHLIIDINGYFDSTSSYTPLEPRRLLDSRPGSPTVDGQSSGLGLRGPQTITELQVTARGGATSSARTAVLNVTVTSPQSDGYLTVWPCGTPKPNTSSLNFSAGQTIANLVIVKLGSSGKACVQSSAPTHIIADINGAFTA